MKLNRLLHLNVKSVVDLWTPTHVVVLLVDRHIINMKSCMIMCGVISAKNVSSFKIVYRNIIYISFHYNQTSFSLIILDWNFSKKIIMI